MALIIISGSVDQDKEGFEFEDLVGTETFANTIDAKHIGITLNDDVVLNSEEIDSCIHRLANALRERQYT
jgi:hypothetical protein